MFPEDPNAPGSPSRLPLDPIEYTQEEKNARSKACVCGKLPFYLGVDVACALHYAPTFDRLVRLRRAIPSGDTAPDEETQFPHPPEALA